MRQVFQCEYCDHRGLADDVAKHELECENNPNLKTCNTCIYATMSFLKITCLKNLDIPFLSVRRNCECHKGKDA